MTSRPQRSKRHHPRHAQRHHALRADRYALPERPTERAALRRAR